MLMFYFYPKCCCILLRRELEVKKKNLIKERTEQKTKTKKVEESPMCY